MAAQGQVDPLVTWGVLLALCFGALFGAWAIGYRQMGPALIQLKRIELYPMTFISDDAEASYKRIQQNYAYAVREVNGDLSGPIRMWRRVMVAGRESGSHYRWPAGLFLVGLGLYALFTDRTAQFKNRHTLESLMKTQAITWPVIQPLLKYNPGAAKGRPPGARVPLELPMFAEPLYPEEWMAYYKIRVVQGVPDRDQIRRALFLQLCGRFESVETLPPHIYCLLAAFTLKGTQKRTESDTLLGEIATCWSADNGFVPTTALMASADKVLKNPKTLDLLLGIVGNHAYVSTMMIRALAWARQQGGVLAPAQFLWLRGEQRELWYPLNNLGRRAFHVEAAGAMAHYQAELITSRPLVIPRLDSAVVAIVQYLSETKAKIPDLEGAPVAEKKLTQAQSAALVVAAGRKKK